jgi:hypothetical protein
VPHLGSVAYLQVEKEIQNSGSMLRWQAPTRAQLVSPALRLWQAKCTATMLDEHAVSEVKLGPLKSKKCEMRLDCMAKAQPNKGPSESMAPPQC